MTHADQNDDISMNQRLCEMFDIPKGAVGATLRIRAGKLPTLTVTRLVFRSGQLAPTRVSDRYRLVPVGEPK